MAKANASSATRKNPNNLDTPTTSTIAIIKKATTKSLEGKATLGYCLGLDDTSAPCC